MPILLLSALLASLSLVVFGDTCFVSPPSSSARFKSTVMHRRSTLSVSYKDWPSLRCTRGAHIELSSRHGLFGRGSNTSGGGGGASGGFSSAAAGGSGGICGGSGGVRGGSHGSGRCSPGTTRDRFERCCSPGKTLAPGGSGQVIPDGSGRSWLRGLT